MSLLFTVLSLVLVSSESESGAGKGRMPRVKVSPDKRHFVSSDSGKRFTPWGFNYDHDEKGQLIEDYWNADWPRIEGDFREMKQLGANVVRVHLQLGKFMTAADRPNDKTLAKLGKLVKLAEKTDLYLDLTGLGCYHKKDVPPWYDKLAEKDRWNVQARFWEAVAKRCGGSPAIFCYDLMNEPVVPGGSNNRTDWLGAAFGGKHFVQFISLETKGRPRHEIARQWVEHLVSAIRKHDQRTLITVGLVDWSLDRPGLSSGFIPKKIADRLDFISVHIYPRAGKIDEALKTLEGFAIGKPVVIEETFILHCSVGELEQFFKKSRKHASGWIGFYWGKTPAELRQSNSFADAFMLQWLEFFQKQRREMVNSVQK